MRVGRGTTLLIGGARSGKSDLAVQLGEAWTGGVTFAATATAGDDDMAARIERHQAERPSTWALIEAPMLGCAEVRQAVPPDDLLIVDCITLLVANLTFADYDDSAVQDHIAGLAVALSERSAPSIVISNEVGMGIHPETALGRGYRDAMGRSNRELAAHAQTALFVVAGQVLPLQQLDIDW